MERHRRNVGVGALTASLLVASLALNGSANADPGSQGQASSPGKSTSTGVPAGTDVPSGKVMVILADQLSSQPAKGATLAKRRGSAKSAQDRVLAAAGISKAGVKNFTLVNAFATTVTPAQAQKLAKDPRVKSIVPDTVVKSSEDAPASSDAQKSAVMKRALPQTKTPSIPAWGGAKKKAAAEDPWALCPKDPAKPILEPEALQTIKAASPTGKESGQTYATGKGVKVAVIAEGIDPDAPDYKRPDGTSAIVDYKNFSGAPEASVGYGGEIFGDASSIAAQGIVVHDLSKFVHPSHPLPQGCNIQIKGVSPDASIVALNFLGGGTGDDDGPQYSIASSVAQAIDYAVTVQGVNILSESIGAESIPDTSTRNAVDQFNSAAVDQGVVVVASSGDAGVSGTMGSPAINPKVIAAAGTTTLRAHMQIGFTGTSLSNGKWRNGDIASFSSGGFGQAGNLPVLAAPGDSGWAACTDKTDKEGCTDLQGRPSSIELFGGTSQSAPFIAGVGALVIQAYKESHGGKAPSPAIVRQILTGTASDIGAPGTQGGAGQVDALAAVKLAKTYGLGTGQAAKALVVDQDQLLVTGESGETVSKTVTVKNNSNKKVNFTPTVKTLKPSVKPVVQTTTMAATDPTLITQGGAKASYKTVKFNVPAGTDQFSFRFAYGNASDESEGPSKAAPVNLTLLTPSGAYAGNTRPQGGTSALGPSNYGRMDVGKPEAGQWTAVFASAPGIRDVTLGTPIRVPAYTGEINYLPTLNKWANAGSASPKTVTVNGNSTAAFTVQTTLPEASGDTTTTIDLGAPADFTSPKIPVTQRVRIGVNKNGGNFSGNLTGGNGRGGAPASQDSYSLIVPKGKKSLSVKVDFPKGYETQAVRLGLIDPNGVAQSVQANVTLDQDGSSALAETADPIPGEWRVVVIQVVKTFGRQVDTPYRGDVWFDDSGVTSTDLAGMSAGAASPKVLPQGQESTVNVTIKNNASVDRWYYIDPRTSSLESITYPSTKAEMPTQASSVLGSTPIPPQTSRLDATITAPVAVQAQIAGPGELLALSGLTAVGPASHPSGGTAKSTATLSVPSGQLTAGDYAITAGSVGPFGPQGAPKSSATVSPTIYAAGFDRTVSTDGGDPYLPLSVGQPAATGMHLQPGETRVVPVRIDPRTGAVGSVVKGRINVVTRGNTGLFSLILPYLTATDQLVQSFDYAYTVGAAKPQITGTVKDVNAKVIGDVSVKAYDAGGALVQTQRSKSDGTYNLGGLTAGQSYRVCFDPSTTGNATLKAECYNNVAWDGSKKIPATAKAVAAGTAGSPTKGIDAQLEASGAINGVVLDPQGVPVPGVYVLRTNDAGKVDYNTLQASDAQGRYSFSNVSKDPVICVLTSLMTSSPGNPGGLVTECGGKPWGLTQSEALPEGAATVPLTPGAATTHDIKLMAGGKVTGKVTMPDGSPAADSAASVSAFGQKAEIYGSAVNLTVGGQYAIFGLPQLPVTACGSVLSAPTSTCAPSVEMPADLSSVPAGATFVTPKPAQETSGLDIKLTPGAVTSSAKVSTPATVLADKVLKARAH